MIEVTFYSYSRVLKRSFITVEIHRSYSDAQLRASALGWHIQSVKEVA